MRIDCTYRVAADVLGEIRKAKTSRQKSLRAEVDRALVRDTAERLGALRRCARPTCTRPAACGDMDLVQGDEFAVEVDLTEDAA